MAVKKSHERIFFYGTGKCFALRQIYKVFAWKKGIGGEDE